ncbi:MAG: hypothetical protein AB7S38_14520 [Vulcanimicrobiota bacterium]
MGFAPSNGVLKTAVARWLPDPYQYGDHSQALKHGSTEEQTSPEDGTTWPAAS